MPRVEVTGVTVSLVWDDDSRSDIAIKKGELPDGRPYVSVSDSDAVIYVSPEVWPALRDQIQKIMDDICTERQEENRHET